MAAADIGIKLNLDGAAQVQAGLQAIGGALDKVGVSADSIKGAVGGLSGVLTSLVGVATVGGFAALVKGSIDSAAALNDLAIQSGASVEALSGLASVGKLSGQSADSIAVAMNRLAKNMAGATEESKGTGKALEAIGINFATFSRLAPEAQMQAIAKAMDGFADGSGKAAVAMALYGKEGAQMLPFLKDLATVGDLSAKVTTAQAAAADNLGDTLIKLKGSSAAWTKEIAMGMVPVLDQAATAYFDVMNGANGLRDEARKLSADGSIEQWTRNAITGVTYLMDGFSGLKAVIKTIGEGLGALVAAGVETFGGLGAAIAKVLRGDFKGAYDDMAAANKRASAIWASLGETVQGVWSEQTLGSKIRARMAELQAAGNVAEGVKKRLEFVNVADKTDKKAKEDPQAKAYESLVASIQEKISTQELELATGDKLTETEKTRLEIQKMVAKGAITVADAESQATKALLDKLDAAEQARRAEEAAQKRGDEWAKARATEINAQLQSTKATKDQLATQLQANEAIGLTQQAVANLEATRLEAQATQKRELANTIELTEGNILLADAYREQADALADLAKAKRTGAARQAAFDEAKKAEDEWKKTAEKIENSLTDALMRGFESGKGFAANLRDTVVNMFKTLVLRPVVQAIVSPVAGAITGSLGLAGTANAGASALGMASNGLSAYNALASGTIGASVFGSASAYASGLGLSSAAAGSQAAMLAAQTSGFGAAGLAATAEAAGTASTAAASAASAASSASSALAAAAPWALGIMAVAALAKSLDDSGTYHTGGLGGYSTAGGATVGDATKSAGLAFDLNSRDYTRSGEQAAVAMARAVVGIIDSTASTFGQKAGAYAATAFADDSSKSGAWGALMVKLGDQLLIDWKNGTDKWPGREFSNGEAGAKEYAAAVAQDVRDYLVTQVPDWADAALGALGDAPTLEQLGQTVTQINEVQTALTTMGDASKAFATVGEDVATRLVAAMGGAAAAAQSMGSYYSNFYSDTERQAITRWQFTKAAATIGITDLPTTRAGYRALVDSTLAAGQTEVAAALIKYSDVFASFTDNVTTAATSLQQTSTAVADNSPLKSLQAEERNLRIQEAQAFGDTAEEIRLLTDGMTDFERELFLSNRSLSENIAAQQRVNSLRDEATSLQADLLRAQGDEAGALALLTQNMGEAERAQYLRNEALRDEIKAVEAAKEAARKLAADMQALASAADSAAPKLLSGPALADFQNARIAEQLRAAVGGSITGADLAAQSIGSIQAAVLAFARSDAAPAAKTAVLQLAGSLIDLKQSAIDARRATAYNLADTAFAGVERAIASQRKLAETSRTAAEKLKTEVQGVFDSLQTAVADLFGSVDSTKAWQAAQGQQFITAALAAARATGAMPDGKDLARAITAARGGLDAKQYATQAEADFARLVLANELRNLQDISGDQLTEAERQVQAAEDMLAALDSTYETAKRQLDELKGINVGVSITLPAALEALALALTTASTITKPISQTLTSSTGGTFNRTTGIGQTATGQVWDVESVRAAAFDLAAAKGATAVYDAIKESGYTLAQAEKIFGSPAGSLEDEARKMGLPVFHEGTNYVPRTGYALLQQGEAVVPAAYNPAATPGFTGGNTQRLERLVEGLTAEVQRLQSIVNDGNTHQRRTADTLENVTEGGANMRTVAA